MGPASPAISLQRLRDLRATQQSTCPVTEYTFLGSLLVRQLQGTWASEKYFLIYIHPHGLLKEAFCLPVLQKGTAGIEFETDIFFLKQCKLDICAVGKSSGRKPDHQITGFGGWGKGNR